MSKQEQFQYLCFFLLVINGRSKNIKKQYDIQDILSNNEEFLKAINILITIKSLDKIIEENGKSCLYEVKDIQKYFELFLQLKNESDGSIQSLLSAACHFAI